MTEEKQSNYLIYLQNYLLLTNTKIKCKHYPVAFLYPDHPFSIEHQNGAVQIILKDKTSALVRSILSVWSDTDSTAVVKLDDLDRRSMSAIQQTPGVCGGNARIRNTRIPVWTIISFTKQGAADDEILRNYPWLTPDDLKAASSYYEQHQDEIDQVILAQDNDE
jgi:uncharacterized protein (DUF433 family)